MAHELAPHRHHFLRNCLLILFVLLLGALLFVASALQLPQKWGLVKSKAEKVFDETADRAAADEIKAELVASGFSTDGLSVYVLTSRDGNGTAVYAVFDASQGFSFNVSESGDPFLASMAALVRNEAAKENGVREVAIEYRDETGATLLTAGALTEDIVDFADGVITQEEFMQKVGGKADLQNIVQKSTELLK